MKVFGFQDKESGESRGVAYVKFYRASHAALALEEASAEYKAILADPRPPKGGPVASTSHNVGTGNSSYSYNATTPYNSTSSSFSPNAPLPAVYNSKNGIPANLSHEPQLHHTGICADVALLASTCNAEL